MREWRNVHVERPRTSTSGGQEEGGCAGAVVEKGDFVIDLVWEVKSAKELQERHLCCVSMCG